MILKQILLTMNLNKNKKINHKKRELNKLIALVVFCIFLVSLAILPLINKINSLSKKVISEKANIVNKLSKEKNIISLTKELEEVEPILVKFDKIFINDTNQLEFITEVENIATRNKIKQKINLTPPENLSNSKFTIAPIVFNAQGELKDVFQYIKEIESSEFQINIEKVEFNSSSVTSTESGLESVKVTLKLIANTYWKKHETKN